MNVRSKLLQFAAAYEEMLISTKRGIAHTCLLGVAGAALLFWGIRALFMHNINIDPGAVILMIIIGGWIVFDVLFLMTLRFRREG